MCLLAKLFNSKLIEMELELKMVKEEYIETFNILLCYKDLKL